MEVSPDRIQIDHLWKEIRRALDLTEFDLEYVETVWLTGSFAHTGKEIDRTGEESSDIDVIVQLESLSSPIVQNDGRIEETVSVKLEDGDSLGERPVDVLVVAPDEDISAYPTYLIFES